MRIEVIFLLSVLLACLVCKRVGREDDLRREAGGSRKWVVSGQVLKFKAVRRRR